MKRGNNGVLTIAPNHNKGQMLSQIGKWYSEVFLYKGSYGLSIMAQIGVLITMLVNLIMVVTRKLFVALGWKLGGIVGAYEITQVSMIFIATCACAYTWYTAGHIRIGLVRDSMKERPRVVLDTVVALVAMLSTAILVWAVFLQARYAFSISAVTQISYIPTAPFMVIYSVVMAHVTLVFLRSFIGLASKALGKKFARESYLQGQ